MLTRLTRPLPAIRTFILAPPTCSGNVPLHLPSPYSPKMRIIIRLKCLSTEPSKKTASVPYALTAAAETFEQQVQLGDLEFIQHTYEHLRQVVLEAQRRGIAFSGDPASPRVLRTPEDVMARARTLLVTSPRREHAMLHLAIARDLVSVFRSSAEPVHPLVFTVQVLDHHIKQKKLSPLPCMYDHLDHLVEAEPDKASILAVEPITWRPIVWMRELSEDTQRDLADLSPRILLSLPRLFRIRPTSKHHTLVIKGFLSREMPDDAWNWIRRMELQAPSSQSVQASQTPTLWGEMRHISSLRSDHSTHTDADVPNVWVKPLSDDYDLLLRYFSRRGDSVAARMLLAHMPAPSQRSWHYMLTTILSKPVPNLKSRVQAVVQEMEHAGHTVHLGMLGALAGKGPVVSWLGEDILRLLGAPLRDGGHHHHDSAKRLDGKGNFGIAEQVKVADLSNREASETVREMSSQAADIVSAASESKSSTPLAGSPTEEPLPRIIHAGLQEPSAQEPLVHGSVGVPTETSEAEFAAPTLPIPVSGWLRRTAVQQPLITVPETTRENGPLHRPDMVSPTCGSSGTRILDSGQKSNVEIESPATIPSLDSVESEQTAPRALPDQKETRLFPQASQYLIPNTESEFASNPLTSAEGTRQKLSSNTEHCAELSAPATPVVTEESRPQPGEQLIQHQGTARRVSVADGNQVERDNRTRIYHRIRGLIYGAIKRGDLRDASKYYADLIKVALPDIFVATSLLSALCGSASHAPPRPHIMQALRIYKDLVKAEEYDASQGKGWPRVKRLDVWIYNILLRALTAHPPPDTSSRDYGPEERAEYTRSAMNLLADMDARGLRPDERTIASIFLLRFQGTQTHQEAFDCYRDLLKKLESAASSKATSLESTHDTTDASPVLDAFGYKAVLHAFGSLSLPGAPIAPADLWFSIVDDMRARGHAVTVKDYTLFLGAIPYQKTSPLMPRQASLGIPSLEGEEDRTQAMYASVKKVHQKLLLDSNITPDAHLLNTLTNAYQSLGVFEDALQVFNAAWVSGRVDHVTPIIMFDACGHAGRQDVASVIWCMLVAKGWKFDKRTLDTWVECLCRGNVEAACRFVCMHMGQEKAGYQSKGDTRPDLHTCQILLKLAWLTGRNPEVKERIRTHLPQIYAGLSLHYQ